MQKNPYPGKPSTRAKLGAGLVPHLFEKKKSQVQKQNWFVSLNSKPILPRKKGAGFIVFEGLDGSGQSTQTAFLGDFLKKRGYQVILTKEPTQDSQAGRKIRKILKTSSSPTQKEEKFHTKFQKLFAQDRKEHLKNKIAPALKKGKIVVSDRYFFTSFAYGVAEGVSLQKLINMNVKFLLPDLTFILKVIPQVCVQRIKKRDKKTAFFEEEKHFTKAVKVFQTLPKKFKNVYIINGARPKKEVFSRVKALLHQKLNL